MLHLKAVWMAWPLAATQTAVSESDLWGAHVSLRESVRTCACGCVWRVGDGSPSPSDLPVPTPFMASCLGEC